MVARCRIELFGGLRVIQGERSISRFRSQKTAALLAYLAYHPGRDHPREALIEMLWPWGSIGGGRHSLSTALCSLRHQLEPPGVAYGAILAADRISVRLSPNTVTTDVREFETALRAAEQAPDKSKKAQELAEVVRLYRGELLAGVYESWIPAEQVRLSEQFVSAAVELARLLAERGEATAALSHLRRAIESEPLREEPYREVMRLSAARGEPSVALAAYRELERTLAEELHEKPSAATRELARKVKGLTGGEPLRTTAERIPVAPARRIRRRHQAELPTGTVTFLVMGAQEIEPPAARYDSLLREESRSHGGVVVESSSSECVVAFSRAGDALSCAAACQYRAIDPTAAEHRPPSGLAIAIHTSELTLGPDGAYPMIVLARARRLLGAAHSAQILCSEATAGILRHDLNGGLRLRDLGVYRLWGANASERVFQLDYPGCPVTFPALKGEGYASHIPLQLTRFFGRQEEIDKLKELLTSEVRLVTLIGPPGCGKTRLAVEVANRLLEAFHGREWFIPLADLRDDGEIMVRALGSLGTPRSPHSTPLQQIVTVLGEEPAIFVFDNFEHLTALAEEVRTLLEALPNLRCLITSRHSLKLTGEREFLVEPLPTPHASDLSALIGNESVQLFADRAQAVKPDFQLTTGNAAFVAKLCQQLEGVPLAIELAAARSNLFGLSQLRERLRKRETLTRARVRNPAHPYASLPAAVEWSYNLLLPELQRFFAQLAVFRGGLTAEAAEAVCEEPLAIDYLSELAECSLLQRRDTPLGVRFEMLEFISEYAADRLRPSSELHAVRQRHIDFFRRMGDDWIALRPPNKEWLDRVESELANISVAQDSCDSGENGVEDGLWLAARFAEFFLFRGDISVGLRLMERALQRDRNCTASNVRAGALFIAAAFSQQMGNHQNAIRFYDESISIYAVLGDRMGMAGVMNDRANSERLYGDFTSARLHYEEALALNRELGNRTWMCINLLNISGTAGCVGEFDRSFALGEEALTLSRELGARASEANILDLLGLTRLKMGDPTSGRRYLEESLRIHHQQGTSAIQTLSILAYVEAMLCEFDAARSRLISCFRQIHERGLHIATSLFDYASLFIIAVSEHTGEGKLDRKAGLSATMLLGVSDALRESQGTVICKHYEPDLGRARAKLREVLGEQSFRITWADGHSTKLHQAIARAIADLEMITSKAVILK